LKGRHWAQSPTFLPARFLFTEGQSFAITGGTLGKNTRNRGEKKKRTPTNKTPKSWTIFKNPEGEFSYVVTQANQNPIDEDGV